MATKRAPNGPLLRARLVLGLAGYLVWMSLAVSTALMGAQMQRAWLLAGGLLVCLAIVPGPRARGERAGAPAEGLLAIAFERVVCRLGLLRLILVALALALLTGVPSVVAPWP